MFLNPSAIETPSDGRGRSRQLSMPAMLRAAGEWNRSLKIRNAGHCAATTARTPKVRRHDNTRWLRYRCALIMRIESMNLEESGDGSPRN